MNEWIIRALCAAAGAATVKLAEVAVKRLRTKSEESPKEAPVEIETTAEA